MKTKSSLMCSIQEALLEAKCPGCFGKTIKLSECEYDSQTAECESCGCTFSLNLEVARHHVG